jgi:UDP-N-acetylmuramate--alanine ligase
VSYEPKLERIPNRLKGLVLPGDLVITLGAGDIWKVGDAFLALAAKSGSSQARARRAR